MIVLEWLLISLLLFLPQADNQSPAVRFEIQNAGITVNGYFKECTQIIQFDPKNLKESRLEGRAKVSSIDTGIKVRDRHLQGRQYFQANTYPEIVLKSRNITAKGRNSYQGLFDLQIKDVVKEVVIPFQVETKGGEQRLKGQFNLNRLDFRLGEESLVLDNNVVILLDVAVGKK